MFFFFKEGNYLEITKQNKPHKSIAKYFNIFAIIKKTHNLFFPYTNFACVLLSTFLRQIFIPVFFMTFVVGFIVLGRIYEQKIVYSIDFGDNFIINFLLKDVLLNFFKYFIPSDDPILLMVITIIF